MGINSTPTNHRSFTFDGKSTREFGVYTTGKDVFNSPERAVEMISIPGRDGEYALDKGHFTNIEVTYRAGIVADSTTDFAEAISNFRNWLASRKGYCRLTDEYNTEEYRMAVFKNAIALEHEGLLTGEFDVTFDCKPQRYLAIGEELVEIGAWGNTETVSGEIATFEAESDTAIKSLTADINPVQDLHGYDSPWVGGSGKNKLPLTVAQLKADNTSGTWNGNAYTVNNITFTVASDGTITVNGTATATAALYIVNNGVNTFNGMILNGSPSGSVAAECATAVHYYNGGTFTDSAFETGSGLTLKQSDNINILVRVGSGTNVNNKVFKPMIRLSTVTDATYAPYSNICPISGKNSVKTTVRGSNLISPNLTSSTSPYGVTFTVNDDSSITINGTPSMTTGFAVFDYINALNMRVGKTYHIKMMTDKASTLQVQVYKNGSYATSALPNQDLVYTVPSDSVTNYVRIRTGGGEQVDNVTCKVMITLDEEATEYEPPIEDIYTTSLGTTVRGGYVDIVNGLLGVYPYYASYNGETLTGKWMSDRDEYVAGTTPTIGAEVVNMGGTATTSSITGQQVAVIANSVNNVWANSGDVTVEYGHDPAVLTNPTLFDSRPLLEVKGYGDIQLSSSRGTKTISLDSGQIGDISLANNISSYRIEVDPNMFEAGDTVTVDMSYQDFAIVLCTDGTYYNISRTSDSISDSNSDFSTTYLKSLPGAGLQSSEIVYRVTIPTFTFNVGTTSYITDVVSGTITCKAANPSANTFTATFSVTRRYGYLSSTNRITYDALYSTVTTTAAYVTDAIISNQKIYFNSVVGHSTLSRLGNPTYIDCDIGEAYLINDGTAVSLNSYIDLGSDLPTLPSGDTEVTYDNTITKVEVQPNWWKV